MGRRSKGGRKASGVADLREQLDHRTRALEDALQQQSATSEVLSIIRQSPSDAQPVFDAIVQSASRLCGAIFGVVYLCDDDGRLRIVATNNFTPSATTHLHELQQLKRPERSHLGGRAVLDRKIVHVPDVLEDPEYSHELALAGGWRAVIAVPLLHDGIPLGALTAAKAEPGPFSDRQIKLLKTFADQAVIAIENTRLLNELRESLQQQTATADVLKVISSSTGELHPVFKTMLAKAVERCEASFGAMWLVDGEGYRTAAMHGDLPQTYVEQWRSGTLHLPKTDIPMVRAIRSRKTVHTPDMRKEKAYLEGDPLAVSAADIGGIRTLVTVPMLKEGEAVGVITIYRREVLPFNQKQIELVENFAAQAVIAIENTRLLNELRQRTDDLTESLEQQTATSEILEVISNSPTDTQPVFDAIVRSGLNLFPDAVVTISLPDRDLIKLGAIGGVDEAGVEALRGRFPMPLSREFITGTAILDQREIDIANAHEPPNELRAGAQNLLAGGYSAMTVLPMVRGDETIGTLNVVRRNPGPLSDKQRELLRTFANQAVIAIENTRLFNELRHRTDDLSESLEQQTATSEVLKVISSSPGELKPVFDALLANAVRICDAKFGVLFLTEGDAFRYVALHGAPPAFAEARRREPVTRVKPGTTIGRVAATKKPAQTTDIRAEPAYTSDPERIPILELAGARTILGVPMLKESQLVGAIVIYRQEVRPFTDKQTELLSNFAAQAVIAIENTRLLSELRESLQQQTATADVLKVISRSTFDLQTVLDALIESATRLCGATRGHIFQFDGDYLRFAAAYGAWPGFLKHLESHPLRPGPGTIAGRAAFERRTIHSHDVLQEPGYELMEAVKQQGYRTVLAVPMLRESNLRGVITILKTNVEPFTPKQIELIETFADQAMIAIENVRLFESVESRTRELTKSLEDLRTAQDRLVQTEKLASLGQLTAGIAHEIKNPLNFINNFSGVSVELIDELRQALAGANLDNKLRTEITEIADMLQSNLDKVVQHGKRADAIVKNMLLHSRQGSGERRLIDVNALVEESFNLAYHGARAEKKNFDVMVEQSLDPAAGKADLFPQEITRVLLNLISNGVYATAKKALSNDESYKPTLTASTKSFDNRVEIKIRDNGTGIPPEIKDKMFNPFFTTKPAGEGTGLGLSISHDIVVKQHGGSIEVETQSGEFTEIRIILPRTAVFL